MYNRNPDAREGFGWRDLVDHEERSKDERSSPSSCAGRMTVGGSTVREDADDDDDDDEMTTGEERV